jgi:hypothetical protein
LMVISRRTALGFWVGISGSITRSTRVRVDHFAPIYLTVQ